MSSWQHNDTFTLYVYRAVMKSSVLKYLPVNLANILISFGTITILTRLLSAAEFGRYSLVITTLLFTHMALYAWLEAAMARFHERAHVENILATHNKTLYLTAIIFSCVTTSAILAALYFLPIDGRLRLLLTFAFLNTVLHLIYGLTIEAHKAAQRISRYSIVHSTQLLLSFSVGILLIMFTPLKEASPFIGMLIGGAFALVVEIPGVFTRLRGGRFDNTLMREYFTYGSPISFTLILAYALSNGDLFFIKYFMGDEAVGTYSAGYNLANSSLHYMFLWLCMAITPIVITTMERNGQDQARQELSNYGDVLIILTLPAAVGLALVSNEVGFIFGESVRYQAVLIIPWIAFAAFLNALINFYVHQAYVLAKKLNVLAMIMIIPVVVNFVLNFIFIPKFGLSGAVLSTVSAYAIGLIISFVGARRVFQLPLPVLSLIKCVSACGVMALCVNYAPINDNWPDVVRLLSKATIGAVAYISSVLVLNPSDLRLFLRLHYIR